VNFDELEQLNRSVGNPYSFLFGRFVRILRGTLFAIWLALVLIAAVWGFYRLLSVGTL
jgi:hypothetical protein